MESEGKDYVNDYDADVYDLDDTRETFDILMERMATMDEYSTYQRIINDFGKFLTPNLRKTIISKGIDAFGPEFAQNLDSYVHDLEVTQENYKILLKRIKDRDDYSAYSRLLFDFEEFLTPEIRKRLISNVLQLFGEETIQIWGLEI